MSHCFRNSSLTIIWNNLGLSNYNCMKRKLELKKNNNNNNKNTVIISKRNYLLPYLKESWLALMHLWNLSTIPLFWVEHFAKRLLKGVSKGVIERCDEFLKQRDTEAFLKFDSCFLLNLNAKKKHTSPKNCCYST